MLSEKKILKTLPQFHYINAKSIITYLNDYINKYNFNINKLLSQSKYTWNNLMVGLIKLDQEFELTIHMHEHIKNVCQTEEYRVAYNSLLKQKTKFLINKYQDQKLYRALLCLLDEDLDKQQLAALKKYLIFFERYGVKLNNNDKKLLQNIELQLTDNLQIFFDNMVDVLNNWYYLVTDINELSDMSEEYLEFAKKQAIDKGLNGYLLTLNMASYLPILNTCSNRKLRKIVHTALITSNSQYYLCPENTKGKYDNSKVVDKIINLRTQKAKLLGFISHAHEDMHYTKMLNHPKKALDFLYDLQEKVIPKAIIIYQKLQELASKDNIDELEEYDMSFYINKLKSELYNIDYKKVSEYFHETHVMKSLFSILNKLYGINFKLNTEVEVFHDDVKFYDIYDDNGKLIAGIFVDLYMRSGKRSGAWVNTAVSRYEDENSIVRPVVICTCNNKLPVDGKIPLMSLEEMTTLFHEFGHCIHLILTKVKYPQLNFLTVEWDAVELPSKLNENWMRNVKSLHEISRHYQTNEPLDLQVIENIIESEKISMTMTLINQLELSIFDLLLHSTSDDNNVNVLELWHTVRTNVSGKYFNRLNNKNGRPYYFLHIFNTAISYSAGYYSYTWSDIMALDIFAEFLEKDIYNKDLANRYVECILSQGSINKFYENFLNFKGRDVQLDNFINIKCFNKKSIIIIV